MTKFKHTLLSVILLIVYSAVMWIVRILINEADRWHFYWDSITALAYFLSALYLTMITMFYTWRLKLQRFSFKSGKDIFEFIIIPVISLYMIVYTSFTIVNSSIFAYNRRDIFIIHITVLSLCFLSMILAERISHNRRLKIQNAVMTREQELYRTRISDSDQYIREISAIRHDMKNKLLCLSEMLAENKIEQAKDLCGRMKTELENTSYVFSTGNIYLNSILNVLYRKAKQNGINIKTVIKNELEGIDGEDIITLFGNLGDNAIEAQSETVSISVSEKGGYYMLVVKNSITNSVLKKNPQLQSTKESSVYHGHGMIAVRKIAEKYYGEVNCFEEDGQFIASVMLRIPTITENIPTVTK